MIETKLAIHPAAEIFPMMSGSDFAALKEDIRQNGQREPIVCFDDKVLDGRNRYRACEELGIEPELCELESCPDPVAYVLSMNLHRRHLTEGQRAAVAAKVANIKLGDNQHAKAGSANLQTQPVSQSVAATMLSVSPRSVADAKKVLEKGCDTLVQKMEAGEIAPSLAAKFVDAVPNKREQAKDVSKGKPAIQEAVRESRPAPVVPAIGEEKPIEFTLQGDPIFRSDLRSLGVKKGNEAVNVLKLIPASDKKRIDGYRIVLNFIRHNCPEAMADA